MILCQRELYIRCVCVFLFFSDGLILLYSSVVFVPSFVGTDSFEMQWNKEMIAQNHISTIQEPSSLNARQKPLEQAYTIPFHSLAKHFNGRHK